MVIARKFLSSFRSWSSRLGFEQDWYLLVIGAALGTLTALGAVFFHDAVEWLGHQMSNVQEMNLPIWLLPVIPVAGGLVTGLLVHYFASAAKGHGVPQVMDAIIRKKGAIPLRTGIVKTLASISTVGSGGSAGVEGPIVQIGSTIGSVIAKWLGVAAQYVPTLVGCGAAAGIASVFNAPIAGVFFAIEIILRDFSLKTFTPIVVASVFAAATTQAVLGENEAIFSAQLEGYVFTIAELPSYIVLGGLCAVLAVGFTHFLHFCEHMFDRFKLHPIAKPAVGGAMLGIIGVLFIYLTGSYHGSQAAFPAFFGNGYETIRDLISPQFYGKDAVSHVEGLRAVFWVTAALCVFKAVGTVCTLGSGGSGGVFAPSLFMGATAGAAFGVLLGKIGLLGNSTPASYALVGMAAVVAGTTFAPMTAILILFELTREPYVLLPIMIAATIATAVAQVLMRDSIYTAKLRQAGVMIGSGRDLSVLRRVPLSSVKITPLPREPIFASDPLSKLITLHAHHNVPDFVIVERSQNETSPHTYMGMVTGADIRTALIDREAIPLLLVAELLRETMPTLDPNEMLDTVMDKFAKQDTASLCLVDPKTRAPVGMIQRSDVMKTYHKALEEL